MSNKKRWVSDLPAVYHPRNRLIDNPDQCSLVELLAAIIGGKEPEAIAERLCCKFKDLHGLAMASFPDLCDMQGVGLNTAIRLKATISLGRKLLEPVRKGAHVEDAGEAAKHFLPLLSHKDQEYLMVMILNTNKKVLTIKELYKGSLHSASLRIAEVYKDAIGQNAAYIILAHNHPSGSLKPSDEDRNITKDLIEAGKLFEIKLEDHLIVGHADWISMRDHYGYLWGKQIF